MGVFYPLFICSGFYIVWDNILHWLITLHKHILAFRIMVNLYCCCCIIVIINDHRVSKINQTLHSFCKLHVFKCLFALSQCSWGLFLLFYYNRCIKTTALFSLTVHFAFKYFLISDISMEEITLLLWYNLSLVVFHNTAHIVFPKCMNHIGIFF